MSRSGNKTHWRQQSSGRHKHDGNTNNHHPARKAEFDPDQQLRNLTSDRENLVRQITDTSEQYETAVLDGGKKPDAKKLTALRTALQELDASIEAHQGARGRQAAIVAAEEASEPSRRRARFEQAIVEPAERLNAVIEDLMTSVDDCIEVYTTHSQPTRLDALLTPGSMTERGARIGVLNAALALQAARAKFSGR